MQVPASNARLESWQHDAEVLGCSVETMYKHRKRHAQPAGEA